MIFVTAFSIHQINHYFTQYEIKYHFIFHLLDSKILNNLIIATACITGNIRRQSNATDVRLAG